MENVSLIYEIDGDNFSAAGEASTAVKRVLKKLKLPSTIVRRAVICMYEGEINMVIHANGGMAYVDVNAEKIVIRGGQKFRLRCGHGPAEHEAQLR